MSSMRERKVLAFGSFDLIHPGHLFYLRKARALGTELEVIVARDDNILHWKGHEPVHSEKTRLEVVRALKPVDKAILGLKTGNRLNSILKVKPEIVALGHDQKITKREVVNFLKKNNLKAKVVRLPAHQKKKFSSSNSRKRIELDIDELFD